MNTMTTLFVASATTTEAAPSMLPFEIALIIFMVVFLGVAAWTLLAKRGSFDQRAQLPMQDDDINVLQPQPGAK